MLKRRFKIDRQLRQEVKAMPCFLCGSRYRVDPCHITTFGARGIDAWWNIVPMCRSHHEEQHRLMWKRFCEENPKAAALLRELGWEFLEVNGQWKLFNEKENEYERN